MQYTTYILDIQVLSVKVLLRNMPTLKITVVNTKYN
jgi:hypothetical protein